MKNYFKLKKELTTIYLIGLSVVKLNLLPARQNIILYKKN